MWCNILLFNYLFRKKFIVNSLEFIVQPSNWTKFLFFFYFFSAKAHFPKFLEDTKDFVGQARTGEDRVKLQVTYIMYWFLFTYMLVSLMSTLSTPFLLFCRTFEKKNKKQGWLREKTKKSRKNNFCGVARRMLFWKKRVFWRTFSIKVSSGVLGWVNNFRLNTQPWSRVRTFNIMYDNSQNIHHAKDQATLH